jgi:hypothetical protein
VESTESDNQKGGIPEAQWKRIFEIGGMQGLNSEIQVRLV